MVLAVYRFLSYLFAPLVAGIVFWRVLRKNDDQKRYQERFGYASALKTGDVIWFHAASVGEALSLLSIIQLWKAKHPQKQILLTTITTSAEKIIKERLPEGCTHQYLPFDVYPWVKRFLNYWKPEKFIMVESEIWPNLINLCNKNKIEITLLNAKLSSKSMKKWQKFSFFSKCIFSKINCVYAQSEDIREFYHSFGCLRTYVMPHLKYLADPLPYDLEKGKLLNNEIKNRTAWLAISTHPGEEDILIQWHIQLKKEYPQLLTVIIPRHNKRIPELLNNINKQHPQLNVSLHSKTPIPNQNTNLYLVDTLGDVGLFCHHIPIVFLGGTLVPIGGHNILEPLMLQANVVCGPYINGIKTILNDLKDAVFLSQNNIDAFEHIKQLLADPNMAKSMIEKSNQIIQTQKKRVKKLLLEEIIQ